MAAPFKAYDVRGIYGTEVTAELAYDLGRAFADHIGRGKVVVARDMRPSSPELAEALIRGLTEGGSDVIDTGLASTDMLYFSVIHFAAGGGVMVTASHNPAPYNGFKFVREKAIPVGGDSGLDRMEEAIRSRRFGEPPGKGKAEKIEVSNDYLRWMRGFVDPGKLRPLKVVIDCGNGMGGMIVPELFRDSPVEIVPLFFELDGTFPNHQADPLQEINRRDLTAAVLKEKADLGVALDGDADRAFFIDDKGEFASADFILGLLVKPMLKAHPGAKIAYDVRCSNYVPDTVKRLGGTAYMGKVGHAYAKLFMRKIGAEFGGEVSGHYYFRCGDAYFDSGPLTALLLLKELSDNRQTLSEALAETASYHISGEINSTVGDPDAVLEKVRETFGGRGRVLTIDGISVVGEGWWLNVRKSNTEPLVRLNCEARGREEMEKLRDEALAVIRA